MSVEITESRIAKFVKSRNMVTKVRKPLPSQHLRESAKENTFSLRIAVIDEYTYPFQHKRVICLKKLEGKEGLLGWYTTDTAISGLLLALVETS